MKIKLRKIYQKVQWGDSLQGIICYGKMKSPHQFIVEHVLFIDFYLFNIKLEWETMG